MIRQHADGSVTEHEYARNSRNPKADAGNDVLDQCAVPTIPKTTERVVLTRILVISFEQFRPKRASTTA